MEVGGGGVGTGGKKTMSHSSFSRPLVIMKNKDYTVKGAPGPTSFPPPSPPPPHPTPLLPKYHHNIGLNSSDLAVPIPITHTHTHTQWDWCHREFRETGAAIPSLPFSEIPSSNVSLVFLSFIRPANYALSSTERQGQEEPADI